ncbi:hypothetical protein N802_11760 [Knoellia sinensis KCTC 19936]|uniref:Monooxygenase n=1 Tax=Knoellia sinensis KCTC 19936 TaxID=1385520 RepID=A0A0A0J9J3_9MICO|nr:DUF5990 family protein [Knoellia sinensis]KGN34080.1 hypothetical protein N802_11760 [Knoellia sinensis KCTC 19936]
MDVRIVGQPLPSPVIGGRTVLVGMQRGRDVVTPRPISGSSMVFDAALDVVVTPEGVDFRGPWVQGKRGDRFLYLSWGTDEGDGFVMERRAKLMLGVLDPEEMVTAESDDVLEGRLSLVDARGEPVCAAVRPPTIRWALRGSADPV